MNKFRMVDVLGFVVAVAMACGVIVLWASAEPRGMGPRVAVDEPADYTPSLEAGGLLRIAGSETMYPLMIYLAEGFKTAHRRVRVTAEGRGSRTGYLALLNGEADVASSSDGWTDEERAAFRARYGYDAVEFLVGHDALVIFVHPLNPLTRANLAMIRQLFFERSDDLATWEDLTEGAYRLPITRAVRDTHSGTHDSFARKLGLADDAAYAPPFSVMPGHASVFNAVRGDPGAVGYASVAWQYPGVRALAIENEKGEAVPPEAQFIVNGAYPLRRNLFLYAHPESDDAKRRAALEFARYALSGEGRRQLIRAGFFPPENQE